MPFVRVKKPGPITAAGPGAPGATEIIGGSLTWGALGTCQRGSLRGIQRPPVGGREARWQLSAGGAGLIFAGIVEQSLKNDGEASSVELSAPHRPTLDAVGLPVGSPYPLSQFGVIVDPTGPYERMSEIVGRTLEAIETGDYGVTADLQAVIGVPSAAPGAGILQAADALKVECLGYTYNDAITDAIFDPGEGWMKFVYTRTPPAYNYRRTGAATASPPIKETPNTPSIAFDSTNGAGVGASAVYDYFAGTPPPNYTPPVYVPQFGYSFWAWEYTYPADTILTRLEEVAVTVSVDVASVVPQTKDFIWPTAPTTTTTETSQDSGTLITLSARVGGVSISRETLTPMPGQVGVFGARFELPASLKGQTVAFVVEVLQTKGHEVTLTVNAPTATATLHEPNVGAVVMPEGWQTPFVSGPVYELTYEGLVVPPLAIAGLPEGTQYAAGSTAAWHRSEFVSKVTTQAWPGTGQETAYAPVRRG